jgi:nitrogen-specific signal transduction histidine kinase
MLLMGIPFVLLGAVSGMLLGFWLSARAHQIEVEKNSLAVETVRQLTVTLAHHLLNAAAGVGLAASWAIRKEQDEEIRRRLEAIREEARRIEAVVESLKTLDTVATERYIKGSMTMMIDIRKELMERLKRSETEQRPSRPPPSF